MVLVQGLLGWRGWSTLFFILKFNLRPSIVAMIENTSSTAGKQRIFTDIQEWIWMYAPFSSSLCCPLLLPSGTCGGQKLLQINNNWEDEAQFVAEPLLSFTGVSTRRQKSCLGQWVQIKFGSKPLSCAEETLTLISQMWLFLHRANSKKRHCI